MRLRAHLRRSPNRLIAVPRRLDGILYRCADTYSDCIALLVFIVPSKPPVGARRTRLPISFAVQARVELAAMNAANARMIASALLVVAGALCLQARNSEFVVFAIAFMGIGFLALACDWIASFWDRSVR